MCVAVLQTGSNVQGLGYDKSICHVFKRSFDFQCHRREHECTALKCHNVCMIPVTMYCAAVGQAARATEL